VTQAVSVRLFGQFRLLVGATAVAVRSQRLQSLLAYLVVHRQAPVARAHLAFLLWPVSTEAQALTNLRNLLHQLRQLLPDAERYVHVDSLTLQWRLDAAAVVDLVEFETQLAAAEERQAAGEAAEAILALRAAELCYVDELLPACYDDWIAPERERLRLAFLHALEQLAMLLSAAGEPASAVPYAARLVRYDPLHEEGYRQLLALYTATGDRVAALRTYQACAAVLERELGVAPSPATQLAFERSQVSVPVVPDPAAPLPVANRLPVMLTRFIGREADVAEVRRRLAAARLLTLTGPGGAGKTRLALCVASELLAAPELGGRVWWVDLAPVVDPGLVPSAWLTALGVARAGDASVAAALAAQLGAAEALVVTDNCEHLLDACSALTAEVLVRCPGLTVLATSREPLGVVGEAVWPVRPLRLPDRHWQLAPSAAQLPDAMALFVDRATAVLPTFVLNDASGAQIAAICRRVDGLPLAIELAAAAVRVMSVADIAERLETSLDLPPLRSRGGLDRHRTLDAAIDWSHSRLTPAEQALFRQLAVFAGGFTLEAAEAVWLAGADEAQDLLWPLAQLVDKSMVTVGERRARTEYRLLESLRNYGRRALAAAGESDAVHDRHAAFFLSDVERDHPQANPPAEPRWLARIEVAEDDIRAALGWCAARGADQAESLARLATGMVRYWRIRDRVAEATRWLGEVLAQPTGVPPRLRAQALREASTFVMAQGDLDLGGRYLQESLAIWQVLDDPIGQASTETAMAVRAQLLGDFDGAWQLASDSLAHYRAGQDRAGERHALSILGVIRTVQGDLMAARALHEQALALAKELGQRWESAASLNHLTGIAVALGDLAVAQVLCDELYEAVSELGDRTGMAEAQIHRAQLAQAAGQTDVARQALREVVAVYRDLDDPWGTANSLWHLGVLELAAGDLAAATLALRDSVTWNQVAGETLGQVECLEALAHVAALDGEPARAVRLYSATAAWRTKAGSITQAEESERRATDLLATRQALGDADFETAWAQGESDTLEAAVELAMR
jgi:predicted ATPase/DNA-binding SARP family transcriptional activator